MYSQAIRTDYLCHVEMECIYETFYSNEHQHLKGKSKYFLCSYFVSEQCNPLEFPFLRKKTYNTMAIKGSKTNNNIATQILPKVVDDLMYSEGQPTFSPTCGTRYVAHVDTNPMVSLIRKIKFGKSRAKL